MEIACWRCCARCLSSSCCRYAELKLLETKTHYERPKSLGDATSKQQQQQQKQNNENENDEKVLMNKSVRKDDEDEMVAKLLMGAHNLLKCKHQEMTVIKR